MADQCTQLSNDRYRLKNEKHESKKSEKTGTPASTTMDIDSSSLMDAALVSVVGVVDGQGMSHSPCLSGPKDKKKNVCSFEEKSKQPASKPAKSFTDKPAKAVSDSRSARSSAHARINALDQIQQA